MSTENPGGPEGPDTEEGKPSIDLRPSQPEPEEIALEEDPEAAYAGLEFLANSVALQHILDLKEHGDATGAEALMNEWEEDGTLSPATETTSAEPDAGSSGEGPVTHEEHVHLAAGVFLRIYTHWREGTEGMTPTQQLRVQKAKEILRLLGIYDAKKDEFAPEQPKTTQGNIETAHTLLAGSKELFSKGYEPPDMATAEAEPLPRAA